MYPTTTTNVALLLGALSTLTSGHMILKSPTPYGNPTSSPLLADGSNYPCQMPSYTAATRTPWAVGSSQLLSFTGTAVHGGGSCQVSVTTDKAPNFSSKFKVIYSIEGGCPSNVTGNLSGDEKPAQFTFTIPPELPDGDMTMAWSWVNKVGNREFYMDCAPVTVSGGAKDTSAFEKLPDMAVANIPKVNSCVTKENFDYTFDNPGKYGVRDPTGTFQGLCGGQASQSDNFVAPGSGQAPAGGSSGGSSASAIASAPAIGGTPSPSPSLAPSPSPVAALTSTIHTLITVTAPGVFAPSAAVSTGLAQASFVPAPSAASPAPAAPSAGTGTGNSTPGSSCSTDGAIVCNGPSQFAICNHGVAVWQAVAQGTTCTNGQIARRNAASTLRKVVRAT